MFLNKSFSSLSSTLFRQQKQNKNTPPTKSPTLIKQFQTQTLIQQLKGQNQQLKTQNQHLKYELNTFKQQFINTKIQYDNQIRAYDELLEQVRNQLNEKNELCQEFLLRLSQQREQDQKIREEVGKQDENDQNDHNIKKTKNITLRYKQQETQQQTHKTPNQLPKKQNSQSQQVSQLLIQSTISYKQKYQQVLQQLHNIEIKYQNIKNQLENMKYLQSQTKDVSFTGKGQSKISFGFGDLTKQLNEIQQMAQFQHEEGRSRIVVDEEEITVREERIQNLERQNFQLKHELASKAHKLAHIFNAAFEYGGMKLLDFLQQSIGLVEQIQNQVQ